MSFFTMRVSMVCEYEIEADTEAEANDLLEHELPCDLMYVNSVTIIKEDKDETTKPKG